MLRILLLSFYYPPDLSAGAFRASALVDALLRVGHGHVRVDVITATPNRYASFRQDAPAYEQHDAASIYRVRVPQHRSGMLDQAITFYYFYRGVRKLVHGKTYDIIVATSSRLFTAWLGARIKRDCGGKLVLDIRDIFTESIRDVLGPGRAAWLVSILRILERHTLEAADSINVVSPGFVDYIHQHYRDVPMSLVTNGVDDEFAKFGSVSDRAGMNREKVVLYAGNIGAGQALHKIIPDAAAALAGEVRFVIVGDGGRRRELEKEMRVRGLKNIEVREPVNRGELIKLYAEANALLVHVDGLPAFDRVLPSKIFEYAAMGKPIIAGVGSAAEKFLRAHVPGTYFFQRGQSASLVQTIRGMSWTNADRSNFVAQFARRRVMDEFAEQILALTTRFKAGNDRQGSIKPGTPGG